MLQIRQPTDTVTALTISGRGRLITRIVSTCFQLIESGYLQKAVSDALNHDNITAAVPTIPDATAVVNHPEVAAFIINCIEEPFRYASSTDPFYTQTMVSMFAANMGYTPPRKMTMRETVRSILSSCIESDTQNPAVVMQCLDDAFKAAVLTLANLGYLGEIAPLPTRRWP